jgi:DEAD/DEAH box helicase domain-containing protein
MSRGDRALMPDLIKFAYIPQSEHRINGDVQGHKGKERAQSPTYSAYTSSSVGGGLEEEEHVLILDFGELGNSGARKKDPFVIFSLPLSCWIFNCGDRFDTSYSLPPSLSPVALKKLIERRNDRFAKAVDESGSLLLTRKCELMAFIFRLLAATPKDESPVEILKAASRDHLPLDPKSRRVETFALDESSPVTSIPDSQNRPSVEQVLREITGRQSEDYESEDLNEHIGLEWYKGQIAHRKTFQSLPGRSGELYIGSSLISECSNRYYRLT